MNKLEKLVMNHLEKLDGFMGTESGEIKSSKRGRPVVSDSKRQARLAAQTARVAAGHAIKRGRPKNTTTATEAIATEA